MNKNDLVVGEIYKYDFNVVIKYFGKDEGLKHPTLWVKDKTYYATTWGFILNLGLATPQEKEHLQQCIAAGKYVDYVESKLFFNYLIL